ncbi:glycine receptor subunit alpha-2-like isoform X2 [Antedon mediterranea]|uniref:glycine receptor subunit alpha-2-like isoform X2 n=1 Tax=Antedon mediterranea TaxID=105859 RepID=UPI003AF83E92
MKPIHLILFVPPTLLNFIAMQMFSAKWFVYMAVLTLSKGSIANNLTSATSDILDDLLENHDARLRPYIKGPPITVTLSAHVESLSSIKESTMDYVITMFFRQEWHDPRLEFNDTDEITMKGDDASKVWVPDVFFPREKNSRLHDATISNRVIWIKPTGHVMLSMRISLTLACDMELQHFPMDCQICSLNIESYGYNTKELMFRWRKDNPLNMEPNMAIPRFILDNATTNDSCIKTFITGNFSCAKVHFYLSRQMQSYVLQVYIPSVLLVVISWLSFWIDARAAPARVALGITTVLTVTTMTAGIQETLPAVTYAKAIDIWMAMCLCFVFLCLFEYALANYFLVVETNLNKNGSMLEGNTNSFELQSCQQTISNNQEPKSSKTEINEPHLRFRWMRHITARNLDYSARIVFPLLFVIFNLLYWPTYLSKECP